MNKNVKRRAVGITAAAKASGFSPAYIHQVALGKRRDSNILVNLAIKKYVRIIEIPEIDPAQELENMVRRLK